MISTPCVNICKIDPHTECCIGCGRMVEEIEVWGLLTELDRQAIMRSLKERDHGRSTDDPPIEGGEQGS